MVTNEQVLTLAKTIVMVIVVFSSSSVTAAQRNIPKILENF